MHLAQNWQKIDGARMHKANNSAGNGAAAPQAFTLEGARSLNMHDVRPNSYVQTDSGNLYQPVPQPCPYARVV